ncbi:nucleotide-binding universal stress UspA family protein [Flavobacterium nitrogenifigens]|uniref:Nucleotide-binding universal stress UspA family protein n=2 Tax=Flavobacterium TaxID=237 RepID=A0A7W7IXZ9_9FLAO|nr:MULTISPECIES: universal stress protein [Flavobacterium]MBB4802348.1 nucleotide-binding universal stress UspA family protein [Flavobacterium nitrogenifigens]MBB6387306.1 nucleotide-binding universal stress UspA family protein [Flavobacterium notoginsengisoli]
MTSPLTIIAATNFSAIANNAVTYAAGLAKATGAKLILFNSFSLSVHSANSHITADAMQKQIEKAISRLENLAKQTAEMFKIETESICTYSFLEDELPKIIEHTKADVVVMGMAERSFEQELLGNSTTSAIKNLHVPVLAVPEKAHFFNIKKVLYACDSLSFSAIKRFSWIKNALGDFGAEIEFFSVDEKLDDLKEEQHRILMNSNIEKEFEDVKYLYKTVRSNAVIDEIRKEIKNYEADLLIMVPQKYGFWDSLVHRSKTRILATGLDIPLLSFPNY